MVRLCVHRYDTWDRSDVTGGPMYATDVGATNRLAEDQHAAHGVYAASSECGPAPRQAPSTGWGSSTTSARIVGFDRRAGTVAVVALSDPPWHLLQQAVGGGVVQDPAPSTFNARFHDRRARAVVRCTSPEDAAASLSFLREHDLPFVVRSGGHCFAGHSSTSGVVLDVTPMDEVRLDGDLVTVGAGARLGAVYDRLEEDGRAIPAGTCPPVGIAGLALAGGLGILGRRYGLTSDRMVAAQVVLADGRIVTCDEHREPDLFWALRGAGAANFGVATSFVFTTVPAPRAVNFHLAWGFDVAARVIEAWQGWAPSGPDELAASLKLTVSGDQNQRPTVNVYGTAQVSEADTSVLIDDLLRRIDADPTWRWVEDLPFAETRQLWARLPPPGSTFRDLGPAPSEAQHPWLVAKSEFFRHPLPEDAVSDLLEVFAEGRRSAEERELDFMPWGGAYNRVGADATAFVHRGEMFQLKHAATVEPGAPVAARDAAQAFVRRSWEAVHGWGTGGVFPAFPDPDLADAADAYYGANHPRLRQLKARYDPAALFRVPGGQGVSA
jgi:FAD/FMN-containing dehydrogenase